MPRPPCAAHTYCDITIIHSQTSFVGYCGRGVTHTYRSLTGEACLAPTKPCFRKAIEAITALTGGIHVAIIHSQTSLLIISGRGVTHTYRPLTGEACLAPTKPCGGKAINTIYCLYRAHTNYRYCDYSFQDIICRLLRARRASPLQSLAEARL